MNFVKEPSCEGFVIPRSAMKLGKLDDGDGFQMQVFDGTIIVMKRRMTAKDIFDAANAMKCISDTLMRCVMDVCGNCNDCGECGGPDYEDFKPIRIPDNLLMRAGIPTDAKLCAEVDPDDGTVTIMESDAVNLLSDVSVPLIQTLLDRGICTRCLETLMAEGRVIYGND